MGMKNINFFEQHVEKIVLAVALAGFGAMAYLAMQDIAYDPGSGGPVTAANVEQTIASELTKVQTATNNLPEPKPQANNFEALYKSTAQQQPLDAPTLAVTANFGPRNIMPGVVGPTIIDDNAKIATPAPVGPMTDDPAKLPANVDDRLLRAQVMQVKVNTDNVANAQPLESGVVLKTQSMNVVVIDGYVPVGKMLLDILTVKDTKQKIQPPDLQKALIYRIEVLRRDQPVGSTTWSKFEPIPASKGSVPPPELTWSSDSEIASRMVEIETNQLKQILLPDFYRKEDGNPFTAPIITRPLPPVVDTLSTQLAQDIAAARAGGVAVRPAGGAPAPAVPAVGATLSLDQLKTMPVVPFTVWDESVQPDHRYQYQVDVKIVNPNFASKNGLADPKMKDEKFLTVGPVAIPGTVVVHSDMAFFLNDAGKDTVSGSIYKQSNGQWARSEFAAKIGGIIEATVKGELINTKFTIVDYQAGKTNGAARVILRDPVGNLVTRDLPDDWNRDDRQALQNQINAAARAAAAAATATAPAETRPAATRGGRGTTPR